MKNKMKLCPISPTDNMCCEGHKHMPDIEDTYKAMTAECQTVEVVEFDIFDVIEGEYYATSKREKEFEAAGWNKCLKFLEKNGYKIVRCCDE